MPKVYSMTLMFENVEKNYAICIICVSLTDKFPGPSLVLASMFHHFEPNNDFAIRRHLYIFYIYSVYIYFYYF
jgi:hypothetical protein